MRKVVLYIAMSLDGYIADERGGVGWLSGDGSETEDLGSYPVFIKTIDTVILGYKTYHQIVTELSPDTWVYKGKKSYVLTHKKIEPTEEIVFTDKNIADLIDELRKEEGKNIWICGGASIINQLVNREEIDQFCITVIPTILGDGIRLFEKHKKEYPLKLLSVRKYNGMTDLLYEKRKNKE